MKLSELVFETNIVKEELDIRTQGSGRNKKVTVFDTDTGEELKSFTGRGAEGQAEEFRDAERAKQKAPATDTKKSTKTPKATSGKLTPGLVEVNGRWQQIMPDGETILDFGKNQQNAESVDRFIQKQLDNGKSPKAITQMFANPKQFAKLAAELPGIPAPEVKSGSKVVDRLNKFKNMSFDDIMKSPWGKKNPVKIGMLRKLLVIGDIAGVWMGCIAAIEEVDKEIAQATNTKLKEQLELEKQILAGQAYLSLVAVLIPFLKVGSRAKAVVGIAKRAIQWGIAKGAGAATVAGGGPVAAGGGLLAILAVEGAALLTFLILSRPEVQRSIAQLIAGSIFEDVFAGAGAMGNQAITNLDTLLDGKYGSGYLKRTLVTDTVTKGGVEGEYYSDSEWAKKVFGALLFPEGEESRLVPYISVSKREDLMNGILGVETEPQLSSRLDSKGETPTQQTQASGNLSSRLDTKGETPGRPTSFDDMTQQDFVKQAQKMSPGG